ncbi:MAG: ABC transporter permease [Cyclobacteriaceae bacterium]
MIKNFLKIAVRSISRHALYSTLNILGLTIGITASMLLLLYVNDELNYDKFHANAANIYRVNTLATIQDTNMNAATTMAPLGPALYNDYPEVTSFCRLLGVGEELVVKGENRFYEEGFYFADSSFFTMFGFVLIKGDPKTVLTKPESIVLSKSIAEKYFGEEDPIGKEIKTGAEEWTRTVTGIMADVNAKSHVQPRALVSYSTLPDNRTNFWGNISDFLYIELAQGTTAAGFSRNFPDVFDKYVRELFSQFNAHADFTLINIADIHLKSDSEGDPEPGGSMAYIYTFSAIAFFLVLIASINYMNLSTAQATTRAKEVGIRKVMGSHRRQLRWQFLVESTVITLFSSVTSLIFVFFLIPGFNSIAGKSISQLFYLNPYIMLAFLAVTCFVGVFSGSYPAFYLSRFKPVDVLKGRLASGGNAALRKALVVGQFAVSLVMIISTIVVYEQLNYLNTKDLGFNKDLVMRIPLNGSAAMDKYDVLRTTLMQNPNIESVGSGWHTPGNDNLNVQAITVESANGEMIEKVFQTIFIDQHYLPTLEIPIVEGRNFLASVGRDTSDAVIVNQSMVQHMGWDEPIGKKFNVIMDQELNTRGVKVVGVIKDFHVRALRENIEPLVVHMNLVNGSMLLRIAPNEVKETLAHIEQEWQNIVPDRPLEYNFLQQDFEAQYIEDERKGQLFATFSGLSVFIACMGLFGLASFNSAAKRKEIGIRKVIGANLGDIIYLVSFDFVKLMAVSMLIAFPIAYYFMDQWLQEFSYSVEISLLTFVISAVITTVITVLTVGYHSITAALSNPSFSLKEE